MTDFPLIIDGAPVDPGRRFPVINPASFATVGEAPDARPEDLEAAVTAANRAFRAWSAQPEGVWRQACLDIAEVWETHAEELAQLLTAEQGKPLDGFGSRMEVGGMVGFARYYAAIELPRRTIPAEATPPGLPPAEVRLEPRPLGVVAAITPWNYPLVIMANALLPALRAGNAVVVKPSPYTPLATLRAVALIAEVLPRGLVNVLSGGNEIGAALSAHPGVAKIAFTGSTPTGRAIMAAAAPTLKRLTLELGGNDVGLMLDDAEPEAMAEGLFWGAFLNSGQTCGALKRLYVPEALMGRTLAALKAVAEAVPMGDGAVPGTALGPLQNRMQYERVRGLLAEALAQGGEAVTGGLPPDQQQGYFIRPTLVSGVGPGVALVDEEQFGPVLPVIAYRDLDRALAEINANPYGLGGSVWSADAGRARDVARRIETGTVWINQHGAVRPDVPFGGAKQSGLGVVNAPEGLAEYVRMQVIAG